MFYDFLNEIKYNCFFFTKIMSYYYYYHYNCLHVLSRRDFNFPINKDSISAFNYNKIFLRVIFKFI